MKYILYLIVPYLCIGMLWHLEKQDNQRLLKDNAFWKESYEDMHRKCKDALDVANRANATSQTLIDAGNELMRQRDEYKERALKK